MTPEEALSTGFTRWLSAVVPTASARIKAGLPLDPYATSMRVNRYISASLGEIDAGKSLSVGDAAQRVTDLVGAQLVQREGGTPRLTPLGKRILDAWRAIKIADDREDYELPRAVVMVREGSAARAPLYIDALEFWRKLRSLRPAAQWFDSPEALALAIYLNRTEGDYNPFNIIFALRVTLLDDLAPWKAWGKAMKRLAGGNRSALARILEASDSWASRSQGRIAFCRAMELVIVDQTSPDDARALLTTWGHEPAPTGAASG